MAKVAVFIDHDIVIRNFVLSGAFSSIESKHEVVFVFPENHKRVQADLNTLGLCRIRTIPVLGERIYLYKRLYHATVLMNIRRAEARDHKAAMQAWRYLLGLVNFWEAWLFSWPFTLALYRWMILRKIGINDALDSLLNEECPDIVLHPTVLEGLFVSDLVRWGEANGKPTVFLMNSWDNPATKAMMLGFPSRLIVWGEQTRQHAVHHMNVPPERVVSIGAAQFDLYRNPPRESPAEYRRRIGVPPGYKVLLYAGSSKGLNEISHLVRLDEAVERGELKNCFVLYRPHPWRSYPKEEADFFSLNWNHVMIDPAMKDCYQQSRQKKKIHIELASYEDTHVILSAADAVISPLSTILLEAALHGKPVAAYLPDEDMKRNHSLATAASRIHFLDFFDRVDCIKCESLDSLIEDCRRLLQNVDEPGIGEKIKKQCAYFVEPGEQPYAEQLDGLIQTLLDAKSWTTTSEA